MSDESKIDYSSLDDATLLEMFHDDDVADEVSFYIVSDYDRYKSLIFKGISSPDPIISSYSILTAGRATDMDSLQTIREMLNNDDPAILVSAIQVLSWMFDIESKDKFYHLLLSNEPSVAEAAGAAIAMVGSDSDVDTLLSLSVDKDPSIRKIVAETLSLINGEAAFKAVKKMLSLEKNSHIKKVIINCISYFNIPEATEILLSYLDDPDVKIEESSAAGLQRTGLRGHESAILKKVRSDDNRVSYFAIKSLGHGSSKDAAKLLISIYNDKEDNVRLAIIEALGSSAYDSSEFLNNLLLDPNEDVRKEAINSLYRINKKLGIEKALELLKGDPSWIVRYKALDIIDEEHPKGYKRFLEQINDENSYVKSRIDLIIGVDHDK